MIGLIKMMFTIGGVVMFLIWMAAVGKASHDMPGAHGTAIFLTLVTPLVIWWFVRDLIVRPVADAASLLRKRKRR